MNKFEVKYITLGIYGKIEYYNNNRLAFVLKCPYAIVNTMKDLHEYIKEGTNINENFAKYKLLFEKYNKRL